MHSSTCRYELSGPPVENGWVDVPGFGTLEFQIGYLAGGDDLGLTLTVKAGDRYVCSLKNFLSPLLGHEDFGLLAHEVRAVLCRDGLIGSINVPGLKPYISPDGGIDPRFYRDPDIVNTILAWLASDVITHVEDLFVSSDESLADDLERFFSPRGFEYQGKRFRVMLSSSLGEQHPNPSWLKPNAFGDDTVVIVLNTSNDLFNRQSRQIRHCVAIHQIAFRIMHHLFPEAQPHALVHYTNMCLAELALI